MSKQPLQKALENLKTVACDLTSLEVQTYIGNLEVAVKGKKGTTDFEKILEEVRAKGNLKLAAVTKINFDGDGFVLVPEVPMPDHAQKAHDTAVKAGQDVRAGLLELFSSMTGLIIDKV